MTSTYYTIFIITAIFAGVLFIAAAAMFFIFNIPKILGHLTGYTAKKQIKQIQSRTSIQQSNQGYSNHLNSFMEQQRDIAEQVKNQPEPPPTVQTISNNDTTATLNLESYQKKLMPETDILETSQPEIKSTVSASASDMPETSILDTSSESEMTDNLESNQEFFDIVFSIEYVNTDEVI